PKVWVDAQLSHCDPNQVSAAYNHALYVEPRRKMMQDWADRLDLLEQGEVEAASQHLTIRIDGVPVLDESNVADVMPKDVSPVIGGITPHRLSAVPARPVPEPVVEIPVSDLQRERMEMLAAYEAPHNLPVVQ
ncbi:integrase, partial [Pectobacterium parmentieri]|nr:integrase [Pectobacterium parmentieri]MBI0496263.1 integrase [Pectobacterium parmentieri]MBI0575503.1 integrase [Pectobacterium parmentieri]